MNQFIKTYSWICLFVVSFCSIVEAKSSSSSESCASACKPCGKLDKSTCKVKTGCVKIAARTQDFFTGEPVCQTEQESVPSAKIYYRKQGNKSHDKPTIVFVHGVGETSDIWKCAQTELCDSFCTVAMDLRGFGRSSKTPAAPDVGGIHYTTDLNTKDIHELLQKLGITKNIVLVAHSLGANYALSYAVDYPEQLVKLVLTGALPYFIPDCAVAPGCEVSCLNPYTCNPTFCYPYGITSSQLAGLSAPLIDCLTNGGSDKDCMTLWGEFIAPIWYNDPCQNELQKAQQGLVSAVASSTSAITFSAALNGGTEDFSVLLPNITVPTLICYGSDDIVVNPGNSHYIHDNLPNSVLVEFVGKGHQMHVTDYKDFDRLLREFIGACQFSDFTKVLDQGCCVCPLVGPVNYSHHSCK